MSLYDWSKAPEWANYIATDKCGDIWAHEKEPYLNHEEDEWYSSGKYEKLFTDIDFRSSLEERPSDES